MNKPLISRRQFTITATLASGSLLVGCSMPDALSAGAKTDVGAFGPFLRIAPDGALTVISKHIEFGQGNHAGLAAMVAEELDADWAATRVEQAPANAKLYGNKMMQGTQGTGGSSAISDSWDRYRAAGAAARAMFVEAAANRWNVPAGEIAVKDGVVTHKSGKSAAFGDLLADAAKVAPPQAPTLKNPKAFTLIGTDRVRRKDSASKTDGSARFTQDVRLPGMLTAMVAHAPTFGATVGSFDATAARKVPGVVGVYQIPTGVAVVARGTWAAKQGRDALKVVWDESKSEKRGTDQILAEYKSLASGRSQPGKDLKWAAFSAKGDAAKPPAGTILEATYDFPYLAHAAMEPMNCVAQVDGNKCKLTFGSQAQTLDQLNAAKIVGNLPGAIEIETLFAGGSFGRRANLNSDYAAECVQIAKKVGKNTPVKLVWTREDDFGAGLYRPMAHHAVKVVTDKEGMPLYWRHRMVVQSLMKGSMFAGKGDYDPTSVEGAADSPYLKATPVVDAQVLEPDVGVPVLWWRSVGATHTAFVMEHTIDQLAHNAGKDPVEYRRALYAKAGASRHLGALNLAAEKADWGKPAAAGWSRGVAVHECFGSVVAQVADVRVGADGTPEVGRVVTAIDCGTAVSPDQIAAQMEGGTCYGLSAALFGQMTSKAGVVDQKNFDTYRVLRNSEAPTVETYVVASANPPSGVGEPGTPVIAPAVANAILASTGKPTSALPFVKA